MLARILITATMILATASCAVQPSGPPAPVGLKLRVTHGYCPPARSCDLETQAVHEGELIFASYDSLVIYSLKDRLELAVPVGEISKLEVFRGHRGSAAAAARGAATGAVAGAAAGAVVGAAGAAIGSILGSSTGAGEMIGAHAAGGAVVGAAAGAYDGATRGDEVWQEVTIRRLLQDLCRCQEPEGAPADTVIVTSRNF